MKVLYNQWHRRHGPRPTGYDSGLLFRGNDDVEWMVDTPAYFFCTGLIRIIWRALPSSDFAGSLGATLGMTALKLAGVVVAALRVRTTVLFLVIASRR